MKIVAVANSKGGVGKTTLTAALAVQATREKTVDGDPMRVCIVDTDPQESLTEWYVRRSNSGHGDNPALLRGCDTVAEALDRLENSGGYDWCFIDTPPGSSNEIEDAMRAATLTVVPIRPSSLDILASENAVSLAREVSANFLIVINDAVSSDRLSASAQKTLLNYDLPIAETVVRHLKAHIVSMNVGKVGAEVKASSAAKASEDVAALWAEVLEKINGR